MSNTIYTFKENELRYSSKIEFLNGELDSKTKTIRDFIYNFFIEFKKRDNTDLTKFYMNFAYIQRHFIDVGENDNYISFASINRALQSINLLDNNNLFVIKRILVNSKTGNEVKYRVEYRGCNLHYCKKSTVTDAEKFLAVVKNNEKQYKKLQNELKIYNSNNHSFEAVVKNRQLQKDAEKKVAENKKKKSNKKNSKVAENK